MRWLGAFAVVVLLGCGASEKTCSGDGDCELANGGSGVCVETHCAYQDPSCPSGLRYDQHGGGLANECTTAPPADAAVPDAGPDGGPDALPDDAAPPDSPPDDAPVTD